MRKEKIEPEPFGIIAEELRKQIPLKYPSVAVEKYVIISIYCFCLMEKWRRKTRPLHWEMESVGTKKTIQGNGCWIKRKQNKMKKVLSALGFVPEIGQSQYEKELFGETYILINVLKTFIYS